jgi:hypothetical protein
MYFQKLHLNVKEFSKKYLFGLVAFALTTFDRMTFRFSRIFRDHLGSDEGIEDVGDGQANLTPKKLVRQVRLVTNLTRFINTH